MRHIIRHRTIPTPLRASLSRVVSRIRWALASCGSGSRVHAWIDDDENPVVEIRDAQNFPWEFEIDPRDYAGLRLYFRQWFTEE